MLSRILLIFIILVVYGNCEGQNALDYYWQTKLENRTSNLSPIDSNYAAININNYFGVIGFEKDTIIQPKYDNLTANINKSWFIVSKGKLNGVIDMDNQIKIPFDYYSLYYKEGHFIGVTSKKIVLFNDDYEERLEFNQDSFSNISLCSIGVIVEKLYAQAGIMDFTGSWIIKPEFKSIRAYSKGMFVLKTNEKTIIWDSQIDKEIEIDDPNIIFVNKSGYVVKNDKSYNLINFITNQTTEYTEAKTYRNYNNLVVAKDNQKYLLDEKFEVVASGNEINTLYLSHPRHKHHDSQEPLFTIKNDNSLSLVFDNKVVLSGNYIYFYLNGQYVYAVGDNATNIYDMTFNLVRKLELKNVSVEASYLYERKTGDTTKVISPSLKAFDFLGAGTCHFMFPYFYKYDYKSEYRYKIYNSIGKILASIKDESPRKQILQNDGRHILQIQNTGLKGWIVENEVIQPKYLEIHFTLDGRVVANRDQKWGIVDLKDSMLQNFEDSKVVVLPNSNVFAFYKNGKYTISLTDSVFQSSEVKGSNNLFYFKNSQDNWHTITNKEVIIPFQIESVYKNHIVEEGPISKMYLSTTNFKTYRTFDTIYNIDYEDVGVRGDSLIYFNHYYQDKFIVVGDTPLGKIGNLRYYKKGKGIHVVTPSGEPYLLEPLSNISMTKDRLYTFYTEENGAFIFYQNEDPNPFVIEADSIKKVYANIYAVYKGKSKTWINLEDKRNFEPVVDKVTRKTEFNYIGVDSLLYQVLLDENFEVVSEKYERINQIKPGYYQVELNRQFGLLNKAGDLVVPLDKYSSSFRMLGDKLIKLEKDGLIGVYNTEEGKWLPPNKYQDIKSCNIRIPLVGDIYMFRQDGLYGVMDDDCNTILENKYKTIDARGTFLQLTTLDNKYQIYLPQDQQMLPQVFDNMATYWSDKLKFLIRSQGKYLLYIKTELIGESDFPYIDYLYRSDRFSFRDHNGKMGILNDNLSIHVSPVYDHIENYYGSMLKASINRKQGFIDEDGKTLLPIEYDLIDSENGLIFIVKENKKYIFDRDNYTISQIGYDEINSTGEYYILKNSGEITLIDKHHHEIAIVMGQDVLPIQDGVMPIKRDGFWRLYDQSKKLISEEYFRFISSPIVGNYLVIKKDKVDYEVFSLEKVKYNVESIQDMIGVSLSLDSPEWKALKSKGIYQYDSYMGIYKIVRDQNSKLLGIANIVGDVLLPIAYEEINYQYVKGFFGIYRKDGKYGILKSDFTVSSNKFDEIKYKASDPNPIFRARVGEEEFLIDVNGNKVD